MIKDIYNFLQLSDTLSTSGMPAPEQLEEVAQAGVQFVVNLATPKSEGWMPDEGEVFKRLGIEYLSIPVNWDAPTQQDLQSFMDAMDARAGLRVHVHCQANYRATGFVTLYRILRLGWKPDEAFNDLRRIWDPKEYPIWDEFITECLHTK